MSLKLDWSLTEGLTHQELMALIFDDYPEGIMILNVHTVLLYYNRAQSLIDDLAPEEVLGKTILELYRVNDNTSYPTLRCLFTRKALINQPCWYRTNQGKLINSIHNVFPLFNQGQLAGCICFISEYSRLSNRVDLIAAPRAEPPPAAEPKKNPSATYTFDQVITRNPALGQALSIAARAADSPSAIMLYGETGCGKEMFAQAIHNHSRRRARPFLTLNCAAVPESLLEGILFGTTKGAFTGAIDKPGLLEMVDGGTIFLDEINSMPLNLQNKLLRVVQEKKNRRIGAASEKPITLKIISASNVHPQQAVAEGSLRADLFFRLGVVLVGIPPLRERPEDIQLLTRHFIKQFNRLFHKNVAGLTPRVEDFFQRYHWPGNVRELEHALEGAMNLLPEWEKILEPSHFSATLMSGFLNLMNTRRETPAPAFALAPEEAPAIGPKAGPDEPALLARALEAANGNAARAARNLNISPQLLHYKMKKYGLRKKVTVKREGEGSQA